MKKISKLFAMTANQLVKSVSTISSPSIPHSLESNFDLKSSKKSHKYHEPMRLRFMKKSGKVILLLILANSFRFED